MARSPGSKKLILDFFLQNIGVVLTSRQIQEASGGASEWARRVRELRNEEGYQILSHKNWVDLKPNQYLLEASKRVPALPAVSLKKPVHGYLSAMVTSAKCVDWLREIQIHLMNLELSG